jgi:hypothetical protein
MRQQKIVVQGKGHAQSRLREPGRKTSTVLIQKTEVTVAEHRLHEQAILEQQAKRSQTRVTVITPAVGSYAIFVTPNTALARRWFSCTAAQELSGAPTVCSVEEE